MTTQKQIEANRQNALVSTGPRSVEGKEITAKNAIKHGIFSNEIVISKGDGKENQEEYDKLFQQLVDDLQPEGQMEVLLVEKIVVNYWRLKRLVRYETGELRLELDGFREKALESYYNNALNYPMGKAPRQPPMEYYDYTDEVTEQDVQAQEEKISKMEENDYDWSKDKEFRQYLKENHSAAEIKGFSQNKLSREKNKFLQEERQILREMKEVLTWKKKFEIIEKRKAVPDQFVLNKVSKYESSLERSIFRNLAVLKQLQQVRLRNRD